MRPPTMERGSLAQPAAARSPRSVWFIALVVASVTVVAYANSLSAAFVYDDIPSIVDNSHLRTLWPITEALGAPDESTLSGRPVASLSFAINYMFVPAHVRAAVAAPESDAADRLTRFAGAAAAFHAGNVLIHILSALALYGVLRRTLLEAPLRNRLGSAAQGLALAATLLWVVHPLLTSAVTYVAQRVEALASLFFLLTLYAAIRAREPEASARWAIVSVAACALGMGTKAIVVSAPIVVWLWDVIFAGGGRRYRLYAALACTWVLLAVLVWLEPRPHAVGFGFSEWPWWRYLATQPGVILHYLRLAAVPAPLSFVYDWAPVTAWTGAALPVAIVTTLVALTVTGLHRRRPVAFAGAVFFLVLAPTSSVLPIVTEIAAEHRMYLPLAAVLAVVVVGGYAMLTARLGVRLAARVGVPIVLAAIVALTGMTRARNRDYATDLTLWADTVAKQPTHARAHMNYGVALAAVGRLADAEAEYRAAERLAPDDKLVLSNLATTLTEEQKWDEALPRLERVVTLLPSDPDLRRCLAEALTAKGQPARAIEEYLTELTLRPDDLLALNRVARLLMTTPDEHVRDRSRALAFAERAVVLTARRDPGSLDTLAVALAEVGRFPEAAAAEAEAVAQGEGRIDPSALAGLRVRLALFQAGRKFTGSVR